MSVCPTSPVLTICSTTFISGIGVHLYFGWAGIEGQGRRSKLKVNS